MSMRDSIMDDRRRVVCCVVRPSTSELESGDVAHPIALLVHPLRGMV
jgi:hypothetical protein